MSKLVSTLVTLAQSKSPVQYIPGDDRFPNVYRGSTEKAEKLLGYKPSITVDEGLQRVVRAYLKLTEYYLANKIGSTCRAASPSIPENSDENLGKLDNCVVHVEVNIRGQFAGLVPPAKNARSEWTTSMDMPSLNLRTMISSHSNPKWNSDLHYGLDSATREERRRRSRSRKGSEKRLLRIKRLDDDEWVYLGLKKMVSSELRPGPLVLEGISEKDLLKMNTTVFVDWELEANAEQGTVRLLVPGTNLVLMAPTFVGRNFSLVEKEAGHEDNGKGPSRTNEGELVEVEDVWPMKISPVCCPAPSPWPFFRDHRKYTCWGFSLPLHCR